MKAHTPKVFMTEMQIRHKIREFLEEEYQAGQADQRDIDLLAAHEVFGAGEKRLERFNDRCNELVDECNQWHKDDPIDGFKIARERVRNELKKYGVEVK